ncbi:MAG: arginine--tRNA ligase [Cytophagales bacterium]
MSLELQLSGLVKQAIKSLYNEEISQEIAFQATRKEFEGSHTLVVFPYTKLSKLSPEATGTAIGEYLLSNSTLVSKFNVVKGFLNLSISDRIWVDSVQQLVQSPQVAQLPSNGQKVMVEYSSPNTNKPLHLGHLRNNFLGYAVAEILKASGYNVTKANLVNDRGIHICKSMLAYQKFGNGETPESSGLKGDHLVGKYYVEFDKNLKAQAAELKNEGWSDEDIEKKNPLLLEAQEMLRKWEQGDAETVALWKKMNSWVYEGFGATYKKMGVDFDKFYYESDTYLLGKEVVEEGLKNGVFYQKEDKSVWIDLTAEGLDNKLVLRGDGTSVYITQDMGTADLKYKEFGVDKSIYVVGNEQDYHFVVLKHIMKKLGRPFANEIHHLSYGMVDLPSGKMKSREGTVVDADDLIAETISECAAYTKESGKIDDIPTQEAELLFETLGLGALKYYLLKVDPKKRMLFNPQESIDLHGHTGPYIQYTHARIKSILRKAEELGIQASFEVNIIEPAERELAIVLASLDAKIKEASAELAPSVIANYVYDLAKTYNTFYNELSILKENEPAKLQFRIALCTATAAVIKACMKMLGIHVPERM